jgi:hypothetical protein
MNHGFFHLRASIRPRGQQPGIEYSQPLVKICLDLTKILNPINILFKNS